MDGEGFAAAAKRSVITVINTTTSLPFPLKVAGDVNTGAEKIVKMLGAKLDVRVNPKLLAAAANATKTRLR